VKRFSRTSVFLDRAARRVCILLCDKRSIHRDTLLSANSTSEGFGPFLVWNHKVATNHLIYARVYSLAFP
jgi:hypothetical protein